MEEQYLQLLQHLLTCEERSTRNGTTLSTFGYQLRCNLQEGFPLLTTKKMFFRGIVEELRWFLNGDTNVQNLRVKKVHIWDHNTKSRDYDAGPVYGFQWRHFGAKYNTCHDSYKGQGVDQIAKVVDLIKNNPTSRRILISAWNPSDQDQMALPPCHVSYQFYVQDNMLSCQLYQRSSDAFLGLPFNIASTALLTHILAKHCGLQVGDLIITLGDVHLYTEHVDAAQKQLTRVPYTLPSLAVELDELDIKEYTLSNYRHHSKILAPML